MYGCSFWHPQQRSGNLRQMTGFTEGLHVKLRAVVGLGAPPAAAEFELGRENAILQFPCGNPILVRGNFFDGWRLSKRQRRPKAGYARVTQCA